VRVAKTGSQKLGDNAKWTSETTGLKNDGEIGWGRTRNAAQAGRKFRLEVKPSGRDRRGRNGARPDAVPNPERGVRGHKLKTTRNARKQKPGARETASRILKKCGGENRDAGRGGRRVEVKEIYSPY